MQEKSEKKGWGGRRDGSGRKKTCARRVFFSANEKVAAILDDVETPLSEFINEAIETYAKERNKRTIFGLEISIERDKD